MTQTDKKQSPFENINKLKGLLGSLSVLSNQIKNQRASVDGIAKGLKEQQNKIAVLKTHEEGKAKSSAVIEALRKQRDEERKAAEERHDIKTEAKKQSNNLVNKPAGAFQTKQPFSQNNFNRNNNQTGNRYNNNQQNGQKPNVAYNRYNNNTNNANYNNNKFGANAEHTYVPRNNTQQGGFNRPGFTPRPAGFVPNKFGGAPNRPYTPRPAGNAGGSALGTAKPTERFTGKVDTYTANKKKGKSHSYAGEKPVMDKRALLRRGYIEEQEIEERMSTRVYRSKKAKENAKEVSDKKPDSIVITTNPISIKALSEKMGYPAATIMKQLMVLGEMCTINSFVSFDMAELIAMDFGVTLELKLEQTSEQKMQEVHKKAKTEGEENLVTRAPVVTIMGHVDHGKTSLLDKIRKSNVVSGESGGITQHIGAYSIITKNKKITFIDTPGHAAFNKMRARGAQVTDIAILIVAADDGVMPQTIEAIEHIRQAKVPMIVAINKMDKPEANPDRVKQQLTEYGVVPEDWGGNDIIVPISAQSGLGLDTLLDTIILVAEMNGYKANKEKEAQGTVLEARLDKLKGVLATVLIQSGTLKVGNYMLAGTTSGKVKAMYDENGKSLKLAGPSTPVVVLGFNDVPKAGDAAYVVDEKLSKQVVEDRLKKIKTDKVNIKQNLSADAFFGKVAAGNKTPYNIILRADVSGSKEAIIQSIAEIISDEVEVKVISSGVGNITASDVNLAVSSGATIIAFNSKETIDAKELA
ncbi:MAG: translation initiation factor IF-2, partial [Firmicutes bacterium]|nr:translation initiation factor IF-2 [Bacillota bacterium]